MISGYSTVTARPAMTPAPKTTNPRGRTARSPKSRVKAAKPRSADNTSTKSIEANASMSVAAPSTTATATPVPASNLSATFRANTNKRTAGTVAPSRPNTQIILSAPAAPVSAVPFPLRGHTGGASHLEHGEFNKRKPGSAHRVVVTVKVGEIVRLPRVPVDLRRSIRKSPHERVVRTLVPRQTAGGIQLRRDQCV